MTCLNVLKLDRIATPMQVHLNVIAIKNGGCTL